METIKHLIILEIIAFEQHVDIFKMYQYILEGICR